MPQQINLCTPILLKPKRYFSAQTMAISLGVFVLLGGALCGVWVWNLKAASAGFAKTMATQAPEIDALKTAILNSKKNALPPDPALLQQAQDLQKAVAQREQLLAALRAGMFKPGEGHSDRLQLVARSIPAPAWVTEVKAEQGRFEVSGFTLDPAALNDWVERMAGSPLMKGMRLGTVKVENALAAQPKVPGAAATAPVAAPRAVWSFNLVSLEPPPAPPLAGTAGSKP
jgi:Tfp pilus assembly protein PilN